MEDWIGQIVFHADVETKLIDKHRLTTREVIEAVAHGGHDRAVWDEHALYGERLVVVGSTAAGRPVICYLRPLDRTDGTWECLTAYERRRR